MYFFHFICCHVCDWHAFSNKRQLACLLVCVCVCVCVTNGGVRSCMYCVAFSFISPLTISIVSVYVCLCVIMKPVNFKPDLNQCVNECERCCVNKTADCATVWKCAKKCKMEKWILYHAYGERGQTDVDNNILPYEDLWTDGALSMNTVHTRQLPSQALSRTRRPALCLHCGSTSLVSYGWT